MSKPEEPARRQTERRLETREWEFRLQMVERGLTGIAVQTSEWAKAGQSDRTELRRDMADLRADVAQRASEIREDLKQATDEIAAALKEHVAADKRERDAIRAEIKPLTDAAKFRAGAAWMLTKIVAGTSAVVGAGWAVLTADIKWPWTH